MSIQSNTAVALLATTLVTAWAAPVEAGTVATDTVNIAIAPVVPISNAAFVYNFTTGSSSTFTNVLLIDGTISTPQTLSVSVPQGATFGFFTVVGTYVGTEPQNVTVALGIPPQDTVGMDFNALFDEGLVNEAQLQTALIADNVTTIMNFARFNNELLGRYTSVPTGSAAFATLYNFSNATFNGSVASAVNGAVPAPEPATLGSLALAGLTTLRRRRRA